MFERLVGHYGTKVGAADADVPLATPDAVGEIGHLAEHNMDLGHDIFPIHDDGCALRRAQGHVQDGAVFREVDFLAAEHGRDPSAQIGFLGQLNQKFKRFVGNAVLRVIQVEADRLGCQTIAAFRVIGEQFSQMQPLQLFVMVGESLPGRSLGKRFDAAGCTHDFSVG